MNNWMNWSLPLFRAFGVLVKVHILYILVTATLFLRTVVMKDSYVSLADTFLFTVPLVFVVILLHEFGHIFGGRAVGGEGDEILMWPLGGLAFVDVPREWKAHTIMVLSGPAVNVGLCVVTALVLAAAGFIPTLNPLPTSANNPFTSPMYNFHNGRTYTSEYGLRLYEPNSSVPVPAERHRELTLANQVKLVEKEDASGDKSVIAGKPDDMAKIAEQMVGYERALAPTWIVWVNRIFWLNWFLLLFNMLLPAYPMDAAQTLQGLVWWRTDYATGLRVACVCGYVFGGLLMIAGLVTNESILVGLSLFCLFESYRRLHALQTEGGEFGYDFSGGYSTLDGDDPPAKRPRKPGFFKRWLQARASRRLKREHEQRTKDDARMDELLDKIARKEPLTAEEKRFMQRVSERYRK